MIKAGDWCAAAALAEKLVNSPAAHREAPDPLLAFQSRLLLSRFSLGFWKGGNTLSLEASVCYWELMIG